MWFVQSAYELFTTRPAGAHHNATAGPQRRGNSFKAQDASTLNKYCDLKKASPRGVFLSKKFKIEIGFSYLNVKPRLFSARIFSHKILNII